jgi:hypothetical protein
MMPKAHIPKTKKFESWSDVRGEKRNIPPKAKENWKKETAALPLEPKQWVMISIYE